MSDTVKSSSKDLLKDIDLKTILPSTSWNKGLAILFLFDRFSVHGVSISVQFFFRCSISSIVENLLEQTDNYWVIKIPVLNGLISKCCVNLTL